MEIPFHIATGFEKNEKLSLVTRELKCNWNFSGEK
jgi:hypothetical protein